MSAPATLIKQNKELCLKICRELERIHAGEMAAQVNAMGVIQIYISEKHEQDVISAQVAAEWLRLLKDESDAAVNRPGAFDGALADLNEAQAIYGMYGSKTINPQPDKVTQYPHFDRGQISRGPAVETGDDYGSQIDDARSAFKDGVE